MHNIGNQETCQISKDWEWEVNSELNLILQYLYPVSYCPWTADLFQPFHHTKVSQNYFVQTTTWFHLPTQHNVFHPELVPWSFHVEKHPAVLVSGNVRERGMIGWHNEFAQMNCVHCTIVCCFVCSYSSVAPALYHVESRWKHCCLSFVCMASLQ